MRWGSINNSLYKLHDATFQLQSLGFWKLIYSDVNAAELGRGRHYEISFVSDAKLHKVSQKLRDLGNSSPWINQLKNGLIEFGWTYSHLDRLPLELTEKMARRLIAGTGSKLLGLSIYSPEFLVAK
jgi:hypothetical protein